MDYCRGDGVAVASAEPYASYLHFAPEDNHASTSSVRFFAWCPSWHLTNSVKALKAIQSDVVILLQMISTFAIDIAVTKFCRPYLLTVAGSTDYINAVFADVSV